MRLTFAGRAISNQFGYESRGLRVGFSHRVELLNQRGHYPRRSLSDCLPGRLRYGCDKGFCRPEIAIYLSAVPADPESVNRAIYVGENRAVIALWHTASNVGAGRPGG